MAVTQKTAENFGLDQGATFSKNFTVTTDGSTAYDISGLTLQAQMRKGYDSSSATATKLKVGSLLVNSSREHSYPKKGTVRKIE